MKFLTETGTWLNSQELHERNIAGISDTIVAGEDEDGSWSYVIAEAAKTKRKGGEDLHASDFAYVGDAQDPSTWKLPIHDAAHARNALARFDQTQGIPASEKSAVLAKIKSAAKKFGVDVSESVDVDEEEMVENWVTLGDGRRINVGGGTESAQSKAQGKKYADAANAKHDAMATKAMADPARQFHVMVKNPAHNGGKEFTDRTFSTRAQAESHASGLMADLPHLSARVVDKGSSGKFVPYNFSGGASGYN